MRLCEFIKTTDIIRAELEERLIGYSFEFDIKGTTSNETRFSLICENMETGFQMHETIIYEEGQIVNLHKLIKKLEKHSG